MIEDYLRAFSGKLYMFTDRQKKPVLRQVREDLEEAKAGLIEHGEDSVQAEKLAVRQFPPPSELAAEWNESEQERYDEQFQPRNLGLGSLLSQGMLVPLFFLQWPIMHGSWNDPGRYAFWLTALVIGLLVFMFYFRRRPNAYLLSVVKQMRWVYAALLAAVPIHLGLFFLIGTGDLMFSLVYGAVFLALLLAFGLVFERWRKRALQLPH